MFFVNQLKWFRCRLADRVNICYVQLRYLQHVTSWNKEHRLGEFDIHGLLVDDGCSRRVRRRRHG